MKYLRTILTTTIVIVSFIFVTGNVYGTTYYVAKNGNDSNSGTEAQPWLTIQKAANTIVAGDTVYVKEGTYNEIVSPQNSGSSQSYITYSAYSGDTVTIDGNNITLPSYESGLFEVENKSYIKISELRIINAGPNDNNAGIYVDNSSHVIIENNYTYNTVSSGIGVWNSNNITIDGNEVQLACNDGEQESITVAGTDTFEIKNNHVHHSGPGTKGGEGIDAKDGSSNGKIFNNYVHDIQGERPGIYLDSWDKHTFDIDVYQNIIHGNGAGISLASENGGLLENINIYNNIAYDNRINGLEIGNWGEAGVSQRPVEKVTFINNTVYDNGSNSWGGGIQLENPDAKNIIIRNNIFSQNLLFQISNEAKLSETNLTVDHNLIHDYTGEYEYEIRGTDYVEGDPKFANPSGADFHLQGNSPAINQGSSTDAPNDDYDRNQRPQGAGYDIGAYEYIESNSTKDKKIYFPHIASDGAWETEICVINTSSEQNLNGDLKTYNNSGQLTASKSITLGSNARREIIIGDDFSNPKDIGYIIFESDSQSVSGYTKFYIKGKYRVAIPAASDVNTGDIYVSHIASDLNWTTGISILNTTSSSKDLTIEFDNGTTKSKSISANEHQAFTIRELFDNVMQPNINSAVIKNGNGIVGLEIFGTTAASGLNYLSGILLKDDTTTNIYYPHIASDTTWGTGVVAYNPSTTSCNLTITPYKDDGTSLSSQTIPLAGQEKYMGTPEILNLPDGTAWFSILASNPITGFELFNTKDGNQLGGYTGVGISGTDGVFAKIDKDGGTGIAFVNIENTSANVTITAYDDNGSVIATNTLSLKAYEKVVNVPSNLFSQDISSATYIEYTSTRNVVGFQLNASSDNMMLDALPGM